jgi:phosphotransferase system enzyme I (PtsI)
MFPMISGVGELRAAKELLAEARAELEARGEPVGRVMVGCMIEIPSAVMTADLLAREADFFSIGTNDLIQYTLAIDRVSEHVAHMYHPLHPAVLRAIDNVVRAAKEAAIPVGTCGAMADEPMHALVLVGLGLDNLSTTPLSLPLIKKILRASHASAGRELVRQAMGLATAEEVEQLVLETLDAELGDFEEASGFHVTDD